MQAQGRETNLKDEGGPSPRRFRHSLAVSSRGRDGGSKRLCKLGGMRFDAVGGRR